MPLDRRRLLMITGSALLAAPLAACAVDNDPETSLRFLRAFFDGLATDGPAKAYEQTSADYKRSHPFDEFSAMVRDRGLDQVAAQRWTNQSQSMTAIFGYSTVTSTFTGTITNKRNERFSVSARVVSKNHDARLDAFEIASSPP